MTRATIDRLFHAALVLSLLGHTAVLGAQLIVPGWKYHPRPLKPPKLVYEPDTPQEQSQWSREFSRVRAPLGEAPGPSAPPSADPLIGYEPEGLGSQALEAAMTVRVGTASGESTPFAGPEGDGAWASAVDLTNLATASQGDPILYTYFRALREQIQHTANAQAWVPAEADASGVVYVGFVIGRTGAIQSAAILSERSADSPTLQGAALDIVKAAAPFLPFPPSFQEAAKAVVVPIEFSVGS